MRVKKKPIICVCTEIIFHIKLQNERTGLKNKMFLNKSLAETKIITLICNLVDGSNGWALCGCI